MSHTVLPPQIGPMDRAIRKVILEICVCGISVYQTKTDTRNSVRRIVVVVLLACIVEPEGESVSTV